MKRGINTYLDGATVRLPNKRISFKETDKKTMISFQFAGDEEPDKPACGHKCHRGKVRDTFIQMSNEAMEALMIAYINYKRERARAKQNGA
jgi:hypothetical protein